MDTDKFPSYKSIRTIFRSSKSLHRVQVIALFPFFSWEILISGDQKNVAKTVRKWEMGGADGYLGMQRLAGQTTLYGPSAGQTGGQGYTYCWEGPGYHSLSHSRPLYLSVRIWSDAFSVNFQVLSLHTCYSPFVSFKFPDFQLKMRRELDSRNFHLDC